MTFASVRAAACAALPVLLGCQGNVPAPVIERVTPDRGYTDRPQRLVIAGGNFLPSYRIESRSGHRVAQARGFSGRIGSDEGWATLRDFAWRSPEELSATLEPGLPAGRQRYAIEVRDPRGAIARVDDAFTAFGPDANAPTIEFEAPSPNTPAAAGVTLPCHIVVLDTEPGVLTIVRWELRVMGLVEKGRCALLPSPNAVSCQFEVTLPLGVPEGTDAELWVSATDDATVANVTQRSLFFRVRAPPTISSIQPIRGGTAGGTDILIRGTGFLRESRAFLGTLPLVPDGGTVVDENTISGRAPMHDSGPVDVVVRTPLGEVRAASVFAYHEPPTIEAIDPAIGAPEGDTPVRITGLRFTSETRILFGPSLALSASLREMIVSSDGRLIMGKTPPGRGRTSVWAFDSDLGFTRLQDIFTWATPQP